jgi:hypothetical protein
MTGDAYLTAPEGPLAAEVKLNPPWAWTLLVLGVVIVVIGGLLL